MEQNFSISDINISVVSEDGLQVSEKWQKFLSPAFFPKMSYRICHREPLPPLPDCWEYADSRVRCGNGGKLRQYLDNHGEPYCTVAEREKDAWDIFPREEQRWGREVAHYFENFDLTHALLPFGVLLLHCAYVLTDRGAILFTAPSGTGKTTQAELWEKHRGARIVNGDRAALRCKENVAMVYGLPFSGSSACCENVTAPILAVVGLSQGKENCIRRLQGSSAVREILQGVYCLPEHRGELPQMFDCAIEMAKRVPVYHLACLPELSAVECLEAELKKLVLPNV